MDKLKTADKLVAAAVRQQSADEMKPPDSLKRKTGTSTSLTSPGFTAFKGQRRGGPSRLQRSVR